MLGQEVLAKKIDKKWISSETPAKLVLTSLQDKLDITFSYSSTQFDNELKVELPPEKDLTLEQAILYIFAPYQVKFTVVSDTKISLTFSPKKIRIHGYLRDAKSGETIIGGVLIHKMTGESYYTNESGYFSITTQDLNTEIEASYLGYKPTKISLQHKGIDIRRDVDLGFVNELKPVVVNERINNNVLYNRVADIIWPEAIETHRSLTGERDPIQSVKAKEGITSGGEGLLGIYVNGGHVDQNLTMMDGMPLYEVSHILGVNSIFVDESVKNVDVIKGGIPARYGGRLSSVVNINLKEGHQEKRERSVSISPIGITFHSDGPIRSEKTTYNFSARKSLINFSLSPLVERTTFLDNFGLNFYDIVGKITHRIGGGGKFSISSYVGGDRLELTKNDTINTQNSFYINNEFNAIQWSNRLVTANYSQALSAKSFLNIHAGALAYKFYSRGNYNILSNTPIFQIKRTVDVQSNSSIQDLQLSASLDYYFDEDLKMKFGLQLDKHWYNPTIKQSSLLVADSTEIVIQPDSAILTNEGSIYAEVNWRINNNFYLYPGIHINNYHVEQQSYTTFQPRIKMILIPNEKSIIAASYGIMAQNLHLLNNPGLGLASDLWIPSTAQIAPSQCRQIDVEYKQSFSKMWHLNVGAYHKSYSNLTEYSLPYDLYANVIVNKDSTIFFNQYNDWRNQIEVGNGTSYGFTIAIEKVVGRWKGAAKYARNRSTRTFANLNNGQSFYAKYDRPNDINLSLSCNVNDRLSLGTNWIYVSGATFSLPNVGYESALNVILIKPSGRNNFRIIPFHQLTVNGEWKFEMLGIQSQLAFGLYNAYNRKNPFYLYVNNSPGSVTPSITKVSILPVMPFVHLTWKW